MLLRRLYSVFALCLAFAAGAAWSQQGNPFGLLQPPQPTESGGQVEVIEFFWYGCPHCYALEPEVNAWLKKMPKNVVFKRIPAYPNENWGEMARVYYTLEAMGLLEKYHQKVFDAMHKENINLANKRIRDDWLGKNGVDVAKFNEVEKSFTVSSKVARAQQLTQAYKVDSVPRLVVNGKYYTSTDIAGGHDRVFAVVDQLVLREMRNR
jgi:thiol:disulfide interchange protein DsbA